MGGIVQDLKGIIEEGRRGAVLSVHATSVLTYWRVGRRIVEEDQGGSSRAEYGTELLKHLSCELVTTFGKNYSERNLRNYRQFYQAFPDYEIWYARVPNLTWTHYRALLSITSEDARYWYVQEASRSNWGARQLERNVGSQYFQRLLASPRRESVVAEMLMKTAPVQPLPEEVVKSPVVAEFLGLAGNSDYTESDLEKAIISHLEKFLLEMGRGFAFVARQQHVSTDAGDFYIDLVFYNYLLKCFFLVDLKTTKVTHQDVGQMDMYVRMFDELKRGEGDNPTVGLLLCAETSSDIAKYSVLKDSKQLFAAKYLTILPTEEELRLEIERQKEIFLMQRKDVQ